MSPSCTVSEISPLVSEVTIQVTINDLEKYFRANARVEVVAQAIVVIRLADDSCIFRHTGTVEVPDS